MERPAPARPDGRLLFAEYLRREHSRSLSPIRNAGAAETLRDVEIPDRAGHVDPQRTAHPGPRLADVSPTREIAKKLRVEQAYQVRLHSTLGNMVDILM